MNRYAQSLYGRIIFIYETELPFDKLSTIFDPSTFWIDVTGIDCEVGYTVDFKEGVGLILTPPQTLKSTENQVKAAETKVKLHQLSLSAMMSNLAGNDISTQSSEYKNIIKGLDDAIAALIPEIFPIWSGDSKEYQKDDRVIYNGTLYKVLSDHISQATWTPTDAPSLFAKVLISDNNILDWEQPDSTNPYMTGDKVKYDDKYYKSLIDNNVWSPSDYPAGWIEITEVS